MNHLSQEDFQSQFKFDPAKSQMIGVERECFLVDPLTDQLTPRADELLKMLAPDGDCSVFSYEPSACQIEMKTQPCRRENLRQELRSLQHTLDAALDTFQLRASFTPVAPADMPMRLYPDPTGRYQSRFTHMDEATRLAAFRVIATNVHIGMPDHATALRVYNELIKYLPVLMDMGDRSQGERLNIYKSVTTDWEPVPFTDWSELYRYAIKHAFVNDPRSWWALLRISRHGTIELRTLDASDSIDEVVRWAHAFQAFCVSVM